MLWTLLFISVVAQSNGNNAANFRLNFKLRGETNQSSYYEDNHHVKYTSGRAIDGNKETCAHTLEEPHSWWRIDMLGIYNIFSISIYNKEISNYGDIVGAHIYVGNSRENNYTACSMNCNRNSSIIANISKRMDNYFEFNTSGRYITVFSPTKQFVILCEVNISGIKKDSPFVLINESKTWEDALNHCRARNMELASILNEEDQTWAELEAMEANTAFVWLGLRYTCTLEFWFWVGDHPLRYNRWATNNTGECDHSVAMGTTGEHLWYIKSDHEKFNFICA